MQEFLSLFDLKIAIIAGVLLLAFFVQLYYYLWFYAAPLRLKRRINKEEYAFLPQLPPISVIICARNESDNLEAFLPSILKQDYPEFEVIVVNDGSTDESEQLLSNLEKEYPRLYHTYVPENVQVKSSKKLALTVGIKAAKYDMLLFTDADCVPASEDWIRSMARNFTPKTDFVLGYGAYERKPGFLSHLISYDTFFSALQFLGFAQRGKPYMGVGRNLAYRKEVFFNRKGFASMLHLQSGDDDLFVNKAANNRNTRIEISKESVTVSLMKTEFKDWFVQKERHLSTSVHYTYKSKRIIGIEVMSRAFFYLAFLVGMLVSPLPILLGFLGVFVLRFTTQAIVINLSAKNFEERRFYSSILLFDIILPLLSLLIMLETKLRRKTKYQWK